MMNLFSLGVADDELREARLDCVEPVERGQQLLAKLQAGTSLFLYGDVGRGKSYLAAALLRARAEQLVADSVALQQGFSLSRDVWLAERLHFVRMNDLLRELKATFDGSAETETQVVDRYSNYELLVIDDLSVARPTEWAVPVIDDIVDFRWRTRKSRQTIITDNLRPEQLVERYGARVVSRVAGMCEVVEIVGADRRMRR